MDNLFWADEVVRKYFEVHSLEKALSLTNQEKRLYELSKIIISTERSMKSVKTLGNI